MSLVVQTFALASDIYVVVFLLSLFLLIGIILCLTSTKNNGWIARGRVPISLAPPASRLIKVMRFLSSHSPAVRGVWSIWPVRLRGQRWKKQRADIREVMSDFDLGSLTLKDKLTCCMQENLKEPCLLWKSRQTFWLYKTSIYKDISLQVPKNTKITFIFHFVTLLRINFVYEDVKHITSIIGPFQSFNIILKLSQKIQKDKNWLSCCLWYSSQNTELYIKSPPLYWQKSAREIFKQWLNKAKTMCMARYHWR